MSADVEKLIRACFAAYVAKDRVRNTEVHTVRGHKIVDVEVYFGWSVPHPVKAGRHKG